MPDQQPPHQFSKLAESLVGDLRGVAPDDPSRSKKRPTQSVAAVVEQLMQHYKIGRASPEQTVREHWSELVGSANASYSHPARIEHNRLVVLAAHSVVRNELFMHREEIVARIRQLPGCQTLRSLNIRAG